MVLLFSGPRRHMLAIQGNDLCFIGLDITTLIGFSPWCAAEPLGSWPHYLALHPFRCLSSQG
jgi:hypothetical protein